MTKSYIVTNSGCTTQAIFVDGLAVDVAPGSEITIESYDLTDERRAHYDARGVEFSEPEAVAGKKKRAGKATQMDDATKAVQAAEEAVVAAEKLLEEAGEDADRKTAAETELAAAKAALAELQAAA